MNRHVHAHVILTGGGLSLDGTQWVAVDHRSPEWSRESLAADFKKMFLRRLKCLLKKLQSESLLLNCQFHQCELTKDVVEANDVRPVRQWAVIGFRFASFGESADNCRNV